MTDPPAPVSAGVAGDPFAAVGPPSEAQRHPGSGSDSGDAVAYDWRRRGRPVRWVAAIVVATSVCALAAVATGAVAPQVSVNETGSGIFAPTTGYVTLVVANQALSDARLTGAGAPVPGLELTGVTAGAAPGSRADVEPAGAGPPHQLIAEDGSTLPVGGVAVSHDTDVEVVLRYEARDCDRARSARTDAVPLRFRTPLGLTRTVDAASGAVPNPLKELIRTLCGAGPTA